MRKDVSFDWSNSNEELLAYTLSSLTDNNIILNLEGIEDGAYEIVLKATNRDGEEVTIKP